MGVPVRSLHVITYALRSGGIYVNTPVELSYVIPPMPFGATGLPTLKLSVENSLPGTNLLLTPSHISICLSTGADVVKSTSAKSSIDEFAIRASTFESS